jgi:anhydro-N-acetylmuramic acid kinase
MEPIWTLGLMSGTSFDGVDAACLLTNGHKIIKKGPGFMRPYPKILQKHIQQIMGQKEWTPEIQWVERELTLFQASIAKELMLLQPCDLVGFHGQTIYHAPPKTWQLGDGDLLARELGIEVIYDFRSEDVSKGGQGAPLVPIFHHAIVQPVKKPCVVLNIGGVANITWINDGMPPFACDTGPGGALIDDWVRSKTGKSYDENGALSAAGTIHPEFLEEWFLDPFFKKLPPKSLDRSTFAKCLKDIQNLSAEDGAATLTEFTVQAIVRALDLMPSKHSELFVAGGGRHNTNMIERLGRALSGEVSDINDLGWDGDLLEAYAFAYLAARVKARLPTSYPTTTGVEHPVCGGILVE